jgi:hypothetical protein
MVASKSTKIPSLLIIKRWKTAIEKLIVRTQIGPKKHGEDRTQMKFKLPPQIKLKNGSQLKDFQVVSMDFQSMTIKACNTRSS